MSLIGFISDQLPFDFFQRTARDMKLYVLRYTSTLIYLVVHSLTHSSTSLFGRNSKNINVLLVSFLVSAVSGFAEEVLFRGLIFKGIFMTFGLLPAFVVSSALFGLAHYPIFVSPLTHSLTLSLTHLLTIDSFRVQMLSWRVFWAGFSLFSISIPATISRYLNHSLTHSLTHYLI